MISQKTLSAWATMFVMVYEWADEETLASTQDERTYFKSNRTPPNHWMIWMGRYTGKKQIPCKHTGMRVQDMGLPLSSPNADGFFECNTQINTFVVGEVLFHSFSTTASVVTPDLDRTYDADLSIHRIWPIQELLVSSSVRSLDYDGAYRVMFTLRNALIETFGLG